MVSYQLYLYTDDETDGNESDSTVHSESDSNAVVIKVSKVKENKRSEMRMLDIYSGCGAVSTGLCLGANMADVNLVTKQRFFSLVGDGDPMSVEKDETENDEEEEDDDGDDIGEEQAPGINLLFSVQLRTCPTDVCKKLRLCSQLIHQFFNESSMVTFDGALSTSWLKSNKTNTYIVFPQESGSESNCDTFSWICVAACGFLFSSCNILVAIWKEESELKGQELENDVLDANYTKGIHLAFELRRPHKLFDLLHAQLVVSMFWYSKKSFYVLPFHVSASLLSFYAIEYNPCY
ncbi:hypothetical protein L1987_39419 [Smallanthus sonchifolius]|uniref:Uncharacterized protein n=1 Tax=Smallanthus sonchifolius TaxID=185202 RepID=A0ACB9HPH9_9ASTR|nr:hypothetical protein L1987_39419 [Smallanthus sonchifolius]